MKTCFLKNIYMCINILQAQDRAYRLGQRRDVQVYRLVATGTLEEQVYKRQVGFQI